MTNEIEYGSDEYFASLQDDHDEEAAAFEAAGWRTLNCSRPFYLHPAGSPDGELRTVADTATQSPGPGFDWWVAAGDVIPPEGAWNGRTVYESKGGEWVAIKTEEANPACHYDEHGNQVEPRNL